jgi:hypothetical protein
MLGSAGAEPLVRQPSDAVPGGRRRQQQTSTCTRVVDRRHS